VCGFGILVLILVLLGGFGFYNHRCIICLIADLTRTHAEPRRSCKVTSFQHGDLFSSMVVAICVFTGAADDARARRRHCDCG
jgi:hypothetical protein